MGRCVLVPWLVASAVLSSCGGAIDDPDCPGQEEGAWGCYKVGEPEYAAMQNLLKPPVGSVKPPPDCSVCSPLSRPSAPAFFTSSPRELPQYLMSTECLVDHVQSRGTLR